MQIIQIFSGFRTHTLWKVRYGFSKIKVRIRKNAMDWGLWDKKCGPTLSKFSLLCTWTFISRTIKAICTKVPANLGFRLNLGILKLAKWLFYNEIKLRDLYLQYCNIVHRFIAIYLFLDYLKRKANLLILKKRLAVKKILFLFYFPFSFSIIKL